MSSCLYAQVDTLEYLFLGHTYEFKSYDQKVDFRLEGLDLEGYDQLWLGGDVCSESTAKYATLEYIDSLFDIGDQKNHWAIGNHDHRNGNLEWIEELTKRNDYYTSYQDGISIVVWNTNINPSDCENLNKQYRMTMNVCDTIAVSSHLILLYHHDVWPNVPGLPPGAVNSHGTLEYYATSCDSVNAYFYNTVYPALVEVQERGIQVINIMGDAGWGDPAAHMTEDGIWFMASGLSATFFKDNEAAFLQSADEVLLIKHIPEEERIWWEYHSLDSLYNH